MTTRLAVTNRERLQAIGQVRVKPLQRHAFDRETTMKDGQHDVMVNTMKDGQHDVIDNTMKVGQHDVMDNTMKDGQHDVMVNRVED